MRCVVCMAEIAGGGERYANSYERVRKMSPCCSEACVAQFDPDTHWIPGARPAPLDDAERGRLLRVMRDRMTAGDNPTVIVRELLAAGIDPRVIRNHLGEASSTAAANHAAAARGSVGRAVLALFTGRWLIRESADKRDPAAIDAAVASIEAWQRAFP